MSSHQRCGCRKLSHAVYLLVGCASRVNGRSAPVVELEQPEFTRPGGTIQ